MLSLRHATGSPGHAVPERMGPRLTRAHAATILVITVMAIGAYLLLDRVVRVQRASAAAIELTDRASMLAQRVAALTAQYELGNTAARPALLATVDRFEQTHWHAVAGDRSLDIASAVSDPALRAIYFTGSAPLDATATAFISRARHVAALSPHDPAFAAAAAPLFVAAQRPLLDALETAARTRRIRSEAEIAVLENVAGAGVLVVLVTLLGATLAVFRPMAARIVDLTREIEELTNTATTDPLTGTLNKRSFQARGAVEIQKARRYGRPLSLLMIDTDQYSAIEQTYGSDGGRTVLKALTSSLFDGTRISDLVARVNDEQFAILLPETSCEGAQLLAERLREKISALSVPIENNLISCTVSIGVAAAEKDASFLWPTFKRADDALFEAKTLGRNRVVVAQAA